MVDRAEMAVHPPVLVQWAHEGRMCGMPTLDECQAAGYMVVGPMDPRYPQSILMAKPVWDGNAPVAW